MTVRFKPQAKTWYHRFSWNRRSYFQGGFRTEKLAKEAEAMRFKDAVQKADCPEPVAQFTTFEEGSHWFLEKYSMKRKRSWVNDRARIKVLNEFFGGKNLWQITSSHVEALREYLKKKGLSSHTVNHYQALLRAIYNRLRKHQKYFGDNPTCYVEMERVPKVHVRFLYPSEEKILTPAVIQHEKLWPYYFVALHTGMRLREVCSIRVKDIDLLGRRIFVPHSKTNRSRYVPVSEELAEFLKGIISGKKLDQLAVGEYTHFTICHWFRKLCRKVGLDDFTFHSLRHTFSSVLLGKGVPIYKVSKILGHSSVVVTEAHYGHLDATALKAAIDQIDGVVTRVLHPKMENWTERILKTY